MANTPDKVINIAANEVGYLEKSVAAYKKNPDIIYEKTAGAGFDNYTKYGKEMHDIYPSVMDFPAPYCDAFADWCFYKAYGVTTAKSLLKGSFDDYTVASCSMYEKKKALHTSPKVGDQVFFTKNGKTSGCYHTGLVYKVDNTYFYTIEGNTSGGSYVVANGGGVAKKKYGIKAYQGKTLFGRPKYDKEETTSKKKTTAEIAKEVIDGKWGDGVDRINTLKKAGYNPDEIQKEVNKLLKVDTQTKTPVPIIAKPTVKYGTTGTQATNLQKDLNYLGFKGANGKALTIDGDFGNNSVYALKSFQKKYDLQIDGEYGPKSYNKMIEVCK